MLRCRLSGTMNGSAIPISSATNSLKESLNNFGTVGTAMATASYFGLTINLNGVSLTLLALKLV